MPRSRTALRTSSLLTMLLTLGAGVSAAQQAPNRHGLWASAGLGYGQLRFHCNGCPEAGTEGAGIFSLRGGYAPDPHVRVGVELAGWRRTGSDDGAWNYLFGISLYPAARSGFFLRAGVGASNFTGVRYGDGPTEEGSGLALTVGVGWDMQLTERVSFSPALNVLSGNEGTTRAAGITTRTGVHQTLVALGLGFTWD